MQRSLFDRYLVEVRYVGAKGSRLPRNVEANPAVYGPGATAQNADRRRVYANCPADGGTCDFSTIAMLRNITRSSYHAAQVSLSRRYAAGLGLNVSYWYSKSLDELSAMNLSGAAAKPLAGENDLAQNPFDLDAEYGPSLFDARHRFVASASWEPRLPAGASAVRGAPCSSGWQLNVIATHNSGTPFTVSDSDERVAAGEQPADLRLRREPAERDRRPERRTAHRRCVDQPFRVPASEPADAGGTVRRRRPQHRARPGLHQRRRLARPHVPLTHGDCGSSAAPNAFNVANHPNFGLPVADLNSANFGRILSAGPPRLLQFAVKLIF